MREQGAIKNSSYMRRGETLSFGISTTSSSSSSSVMRTMHNEAIGRLKKPGKK